jgi:hypothetical protein
MLDVQHITQAVLKLSAALENYDNLCYLEKQGKCEFFKGKFLADSARTTTFFVHHTRIICTNLHKDQPFGWKMFVDGWFSEIDDDVKASSEEKRQLGLFLAKTNSALNHLRSIELTGKNKLFAEPLIKKINVILSPTYLRRLPIKKESLQELTQVLDDLSVRLVPQTLGSKL